jgi:Flp pilus assembly pilin Flp
MLKNFLRDETGAELAEYAVGVALLVAIGVVVYKLLGDAIWTSHDDTSSVINNASYTPPGGGAP